MEGPRYTLGRLLVAVAAAAGVLGVAAVAVRGNPWAIALAVAVAILLLAAALHAISFLVAWWVSILVEWVVPARPEAPFADLEPAPKLVDGADPPLE